MILTNYNIQNNKFDSDRSFKEELSLAIDEYNRHKKMFSLNKIVETGSYDNPYLDFELKLKLRFVRIYFDATSFDHITKERSSTAVDKLSAIGGTMGLLTGFSIISGVEILYFIIKIFFSFVTKNKK